MKSVGESGDILPALVSIMFAFTKFSKFCPSVRRQQTRKPMFRRLLNILFENYAKKINVLLSFVNLDIIIGCFKRRPLHITGSI